jgi:hypothetical protein
VSRAQLYAVEKIVNQCSASLKGHSPGVQSAAIAELLAMWLNGIRMADDVNQLAPASEREAMLEQWVKLVRSLAKLDKPTQH